MIQRGQIYWADLGEPEGSRPAHPRPVVIVQADPFNTSRLATIIALVLTTNQRLAVLPGNVFLPAQATGLPKDSVVNVTAVVTLNKSDCRDLAGTIPPYLMGTIDQGLRTVLNL